MGAQTDRRLGPGAARGVALGVAVALALGATGCRTRDEATGARDGGPHDALAAETRAASSPGTVGAPGALAAGARSAVGSPEGLTPAGSAEPEEPSPPAASADLDRRMRHLVEAIAQDDARLAQDVLLPRDAYLALRDVSDPGRAYDAKLASAFKAQVHKLHGKTRGIEGASMTRFELGSQLTKAPAKRREMKRATWRARHARLTYTVNGKPHHLDVRELVAWRGNWYVLRLR